MYAFVLRSSRGQLARTGRRASREGGGVRTLFTFCGVFVDIGAPLKALAKSTFERVAAAKDALQPKIVVSEAESSESE